MTCPKCGSSQNHCVDSRGRNGSVWRRRECKACRYRFNTVEILEDDFKGMRTREDLLKEFLYSAVRTAVQICEVNPNIDISTFPNGECK